MADKQGKRPQDTATGRAKVSMNRSTHCQALCTLYVLYYIEAVLEVYYLVHSQAHSFLHVLVMQISNQCLHMAEALVSRTKNARDQANR
jgi:hypothetical protein